MRATAWLGVLLLVPTPAFAWGGVGHRTSLHRVVAALDAPARQVFQPLEPALLAACMDPDDRADTDAQERPRHYYDLEALGFPRPDPAAPRPAWDPSLAARRVLRERVAALADPRSDSHRGTLPLAVDRAYAALVAALRAQDRAAILRHATDLLHYVLDAHQPLHATEAYNGLTPAQHGIHADFETGLLDRCPAARPGRLPRLADDGEAPGELVLQALLESSQDVGTLLAVDLGCRARDGRGDPVCRGALPAARARPELKCQPLAALARRRLERGAARSVVLLNRAVAEAATPGSPGP